MLGLMQQRPLLISSLLDYAERYHAGTEIVSRSVEGPIHRSNWGTIAARARRVANALRRLGVDAERAHRHAGLEPQPAPGDLFRRHLQRRRPAHGEPAAVSRAGPLHHRRRRGELCVLRPDIRRPGRATGAASARRARLYRVVRARCAAVRSMCRTCCATRTCWPPRATTTRGRSSTRTPPPRCATRRAPPAIPRVCCRATARRCCTASR